MTAKQKLLVCGATGFIGRNILEYFAKSGKYDVYGTCHKVAPHYTPGVTLIECDLTDPKDVDAFFQRNDNDLLLHHYMYF